MQWGPIVPVSPLEETFRAEVSFYDEAAVPKAFAGQEEEKWEGVNEAIEKIGGGYDEDADEIFIDDVEF